MYGRMTANSIRALRNAKNMTLDELAAKAGLSPGHLSKLETGKRPIHFDHIVKLAVALGCKLADITDEWVDIGMELPGGAILMGPQGNDLEVLGKVAAGHWLEVSSLDDAPIMTIPVPRDNKYGDALIYGLLVEGTSINRVAREGDVLVCLDIGSSGFHPQNGDLVIVERRRKQFGLKEVTAKRYRVTPGGLELWPDSDDPKWQTAIEYDDGDADDEVAVVAIVQWIWRDPRKA